MLKSSFPRQRRLNSCAWNYALLRQAVGEDRRDPPAKEEENPVIHVLQPDPQFVDTVAEKVGFRPTQFVTQ